jgi:hypothetical protein
VASDDARTDRDLGHSVAVVWLWGVPVAALVATSVLANTNRIALSLAGSLFVAGTVWIAVGCWLNARHCGRVHCRLASVHYPVLAADGTLYVAGLIQVPYFWDWYWAAFSLVLIAGFALERILGKYA